MISKLLKTYQYLDHDEAFIDVVTRTSILSLTSLLFTLIPPIFGYLAVSVYQNSLIVEFIGHFAAIFDAASNALCMLLLFQYYDKVYKKLCNSIDVKCKICWKSLTHVQDIQNIKPVNKEPAVTASINIDSKPVNISTVSVSVEP